MSNFTEWKNYYLGQSYVFVHKITRVFVNSEKCAKWQVYYQGNEKALKLYWTITTHYNIFANSTKFSDSLTNTCQTCTLVVGRAGGYLWHHQTGGSAFDDATRPPASTEDSEVWVLGVSSHLLLVKHISVITCGNLVWDYPLVGFCLIYWFQTVN